MILQRHAIECVIKMCYRYIFKERYVGSGRSSKACFKLSKAVKGIFKLYNPFKRRVSERKVSGKGQALKDMLLII